MEQMLERAKGRAVVAASAGAIRDGSRPAAGTAYGEMVPRDGAAATARARRSARRDPRGVRARRDATSSSSPSSIERDGEPSRRYETATRSSSSTSARTACGRSRARSRRRTSTASTSAGGPRLQGRHDDAVRRDVRLPVAFPPFTLASMVGRSHSGTAARSSHGRNGEVRARHLLLQRRRRDAVSGRGSASSCRARRWRRTISRRR